MNYYNSEQAQQDFLKRKVSLSFWCKCIVYVMILQVYQLKSQSFQQVPKKDSLWSIWQNSALHDTVRLKAMQEFTWDGYLFTQPDSAFYFATLQYDYAIKKNQKKFAASALNTQGASFYIQGDYSKAILYYSKSKLIQEEIQNKAGLAATLNNIAAIYKLQGNYTLSIENYSQCQKIYTELNNKEGIAAAFNNIGVLYHDLKEYDKALDYQLKGLEIREEIKDLKGIAGSLHNIGLIYQEQEKFEKALEYYKRSLEVEKQDGNRIGMSETYNNLGNIYSEIGLLDTALVYFNKSLETKKEINQKKGILSLNTNLATTWYKKSLEKSRRGEKPLSSAYLNKALSFAKEAYSLGNEIGSLAEFRDAAEILYKIYRVSNNYKSALEMFETYIQYRDSLNNEENQKAIIRQQFQFEYEKKTAEDSIAFLKENELNLEQIARQQAEIKAKRNQQYALFSGLFFLTVIAGVTYNRFALSKKKNKIILAQNRLVESQKAETEYQRKLLEIKNTEIVSSINYARKIQNAMLPPHPSIENLLGEYFIFYKPKDIISGDFYWIEKHENWVYVAVADCTGHGVPGAMVSFICHNALSRSVGEFALRMPNEILNKTRDILVNEFAGSEENVQDGMDISLCAFNLNMNKLFWAGANNPLWIMNSRKQKNNTYKPDKQPIGSHPMPTPFSLHEIELETDDMIYLFTDGYQDQFGGKDGKKLKKANLMNLIVSIDQLDAHEQHAKLESHFNTWKRDVEQIDDVCFMGIRVK